MKRSLTILAIAFNFYFSPVHAQTKAEMDSLHDYCLICTNHEHVIIKPPYTRKFVKELPFLVVSGVTFAAGIVAGATNNIKPYTEEELLNNPPDINSINSFDRKSALNWSTSAGTTSDYVLWTVTLLPALFLSEHHTERDIKTLVIMYVEVFTINYGLTELAKNITNRSRPYVYNPSAPMETRTGPSSRQSFFSGHTSQTAAASFFFAKVITDYHPTLKPGLKTGLWIFAATIPAINGYLRVQAGKHFPTDVITGYIAGAATGWLIPQLHRTTTSKEAKTKLDLGLFPTNNGMVMHLSCRF